MLPPHLLDDSLAGSGHVSEIAWSLADLVCVVWFCLSENGDFLPAVVEQMGSSADELNFSKPLHCRAIFL